MNWRQRNSLRYYKPAQMTEVQKEIIEAKAGRHLINTYPGHIWHVEVDNGILKIQCPTVNKVYGFEMHLDEIDVNLYKLTLAGGEILERCRVPRHKMAKLEDIGAAERNLLGDIEPDLDTGRNKMKKMDLSQFDNIEFESMLRGEEHTGPITVNITETVGEGVSEKPRESIIIHAR